MSALEKLVERGLVAPDWAEALAPVDQRIEAMGQFLRAELAAGRSYLPAGEHILRAFRRPLAEVRVLVANQSFFGDTSHHAVLDVEVGEPGRAPYLPRSAFWRCGPCRG